MHVTEYSEFFGRYTARKEEKLREETWEKGKRQAKKIEEKGGKGKEMEKRGTAR